jgi:hypothetical protein
MLQFLWQLIGLGLADSQYQAFGFVMLQFLWQLIGLGLADSQYQAFGASSATH